MALIARAGRAQPKAIDAAKLSGQTAILAPLHRAEVTEFHTGKPKLELCFTGGGALSRHDRRALRYPSVATNPTIRRQPLVHWT